MLTPRADGFANRHPTSRANRWLEQLGAALFPQPCLLCQTANARPICPACAKQIEQHTALPNAHCPVCALPTATGDVCGNCLKRPPCFTNTYAAFLYQPPVDTLVTALKYRAELSLVDWLASQMIEKYASHMAENIAHAKQRPDLILPMPLHPQRLAERGFNQAGLLAMAIGKQLGIPVQHDALQRISYTPPQAGLTLRQRIRNIRGAFMSTREFHHQHILLVDDVMTSSSSLRELSRVVDARGAKQISCCVIARTPRPIGK